MKPTAAKYFTQHISHRGTDVNFLLIRLFVKIKAKCVKLRGLGRMPDLYASYAPVFKKRKKKWNYFPISSILDRQ